MENCTHISGGKYLYLDYFEQKRLQRHATKVSFGSKQSLTIRHRPRVFDPHMSVIVIVIKLVALLALQLITTNDRYIHFQGYMGG